MNERARQKFNDDLLLEDGDRTLAKERFPQLMPVLDFAELRCLFEGFELNGLHDKAHRRLMGLFAIGLSACALIGAATTPFLYQAHNIGWGRLIGGVSAVLGIVGVLIGAFGLFSGKSKSQWLCNRLMTERLRQFHFQAMVCGIRLLLTPVATGGASVSEFVRSRSQWFAEFRMAYEGHLPARLQEILDDDSEEGFPLCPEAENEELSRTPAGLQSIFSAYRLFRLQHQIEYASYKLGAGDRLWSSPTRQFRLLRDVGLGLIVLVFVSHLIIATSSVPVSLSALASSHALHFGISLLIIGVLVVRALEEGLQPAREIERYTRYRASLVALLGRFDRAGSDADRIRVMHETERLSYAEMRGFLKTHYEARFVL
jgi:predicted membrane channel-forming protein YqfA (hemolysin III family)